MREKKWKRQTKCVHLDRYLSAFERSETTTEMCEEILRVRSIIKRRKKLEEKLKPLNPNRVIHEINYAFRKKKARRLKIDRLVNRYRFLFRECEAAFSWLNSLCIRHSAFSTMGPAGLNGSFNEEKQIKLITFKHRNDINKKENQSDAASIGRPRWWMGRSRRKTILDYAGRSHESPEHRGGERYTSRLYGIGAKAECHSPFACLLFVNSIRRHA